MGTIRVPSIFTEFDSNEVDLHVPGHEELLKKMAMNNNYLLNLMPVGAIIFVNGSQSGVTLPDINYWQLCDGSEITNPNSPIRTIGIFQRFTPNLFEKFPRGSNDTINNNSGGTHTHNLDHTHSTGATHSGGPFLDARDKGYGEGYYSSIHGHVNLPTVAPFSPIKATKIINKVRYTANQSCIIWKNISLNFIHDFVYGHGIITVTNDSGVIDPNGKRINVTIVPSITTAAQVKSWIDGNSQAAALVTTELTGTGAEVHTIIGKRSLSGGADTGTNEMITPRHVYLLAYMKVV